MSVQQFTLHIPVSVMLVCDMSHKKFKHTVITGHLIILSPAGMIRRNNIGSMLTQCQLVVLTLMKRCINVTFMQGEFLFYILIHSAEKATITQDGRNT